MGTSQSSKGPGSAVPLVPPWADLADLQDIPATSDRDPDAQDPADPTQPTEAVAPTARFRDARRSLGSFARTGNSDYLKRTLRHYVASGYGGSGTMSRRLGGTARTAGRLNNLLQSGGGTGVDGDAIRDAVLRGGKNATDVLDAITNAVSPVDGTQDAETSRRSVRESLSDLLDRHPDADLLDLSESQRGYVIERFTTHEVYGRFLLDMLPTIVKVAGDPQTALTRLRQIREFISTEVSSAFRSIRERGDSTTTANVTGLTAEVLRTTMSVFEEYIE